MKLLRAYDQELLDELQWRVQCEREAQEAERANKREADRKAQLEDIKDTVRDLQSSKSIALAATSCIGAIFAV